MNFKTAVQLVARLEADRWAYETVGDALIVGGASYLASVKAAKAAGVRPRRVYASYPGRVWRVRA